MRRESLKSLKAEQKTIKRVAAEQQPNQFRWYHAEGAFRGLRVNKTTGAPKGKDKCRIAANMDEVLVMIEPTSGQKEQVDGAIRVIVDMAVDRAVATSVLYSTTCVGVAPWVIPKFGMVTAVINFKYDAKTQHVQKNIEQEQRYVRALVRAAKARADWDNILADISMSHHLAPPSPTQLQFLAHDDAEVRDAAGGPEFVYVATSTGRLNVASMLAGAKHFCQRLPEVRRKLKIPADEIVYLYLDNLSFHHSKVVADYLWENGRTQLRFLQKYTTATTQPEDVSCNAPFKKRFREGKREVARYLEALTQSEAFERSVSPAKRAQVLRDLTTGKMGEQWVGPLLCAAARDSFTVKNVNSGFRKCGLFPFDPRQVPGVVEACKMRRLKGKPAPRQRSRTLEEAVLMVPSPSGQVPAAVAGKKRKRRSERREAASGAGASDMELDGTALDAGELIRAEAVERMESAGSRLEKVGPSMGKIKKVV